VFVNFNGISIGRSESLRSVSYDPRSNTILFVGNLYSDWRLHYKGIDLLLEAFAKLKELYSSLRLIILGDHDASLLTMIEAKNPTVYRSGVEITGYTQDLSTQFSKACLYVHPSRGDALPNSLTEALYAGVPAVVTEWTGGCHLVEQIDRSLVCAMDSNSVFESIRYFFSLPEQTKQAYSAKAKALASDLTAERALAKFNSIIREIDAL
jgi:glycosyltransferase involved in cell wall biosynthesis